MKWHDKGFELTKVSSKFMDRQMFRNMLKGLNMGFIRMQLRIEANITKHRLNEDEMLLDILPKLLPEVLLL